MERKIPQRARSWNATWNTRAVKAERFYAALPSPARVDVEATINARRTSASTSRKRASDEALPLIRRFTFFETIQHIHSLPF